MVNKRLLLILLTVTLLAFGCSPAERSLETGNSDSDLQRILQQLVEDSFDATGPGAAVLVRQDDTVLLRTAVGMADIELGVPLSPDHVFRIASLTKQFTAAAILLLQQDNKLDIDDSMTTYLPDYPLGGREVSVRWLMTHTSGIRSYTDMPEWMPRFREVMTVDQIIDMFRDQPFDFEPNEQWHYNNSAYVLLGRIIEEVSGMSYADFLQTRFFDTFSMEHTGYEQREEIIPGRTTGYSKKPDGSTIHATFLSMSQPYAAGGLYSTIDELALWNEVLFDGKVIKEDLVELMVTPHQLNDGTKTDYGLGLQISAVRGEKMYGHSGGIFGFNTFAMWLPEKELYIVVLANSDAPETSAGELSYRLAGQILGRPFPRRMERQPAPEILSPLAGIYKSESGAEITVVLEGDALELQQADRQPATLHAADLRTFLIGKGLSYILFEDGEADIAAAELMRPDGSSVRYVRQPE